MPFAIWFFLKPVLEIVILWWVFYRILAFFEGTRSFQVLKGITYLIIAFLVSQILGFDTLNWLLTKLFALSVVALLIIFQQELRLGLARLGQQHLFNVALAETEIVAIIEEISSAIFKMAKSKTGCLIAIERESKLKTYIESGVMLDGKISCEFILSIFSPLSPLHDGGLITRGERIVAASCLFPLSEDVRVNKTMGTRHRAALGLTEQTDAIVVMVSEQSSEILLAADGRFTSILTPEQFSNTLKELLMRPEKNKK